MEKDNRPTYVYRALTHPDSIRLVELLPGLRGSPLACIIFEVTLASEPEYEAVSYAWGDKTMIYSIGEAYSGAVLPVTVNLHNALQAIRLEQTSRILWIDAACINQADHVEKGPQVALMGQIFQGAARVVVWLDCAKLSKTRLQSLLNDMISTVEKLEIENMHRHSRDDDIGAVVRLMTRVQFSQMAQEPW